MKSFKTIEEMSLKGRRVLVRVDFNVPLQSSDGGYVVTDTTRLVGALRTIRYIVEQGGRCILMSHLGRPDGRVVPKYSLEPVALKLSELLGQDVILTEDCVGDGPRGLSHQLRQGEVMLLENLRFHSGEEANALDFSHRLLELCDTYVSDAFGTLHRAHASTVGVPKLAAEKGLERGIGFLVQRELEALAPLRESPQRPFALIMGGSKISDKIGVLDHFLPRVDKILIGGAMAYAFLKAQGKEVGNSLCDHKQVQLAIRILKGAEARGVKVFLPQDHLTTTAIDNVTDVKLTLDAEIAVGRMGVDIGPKTLTSFREAIAGVETIFWNGPMGVFETGAFAKGTFEVARLVADSTARKLVGGGDSVAAITQAGMEDRFDFISTGGGATLEYLEGKDLPGLKALEVSSRAG